MCYQILFWGMALVVSVFYGRQCFKIHPATMQPEDIRDLGKRKIYARSEYFTNFLGSFIGWVALYFLTFNVNWNNFVVTDIQWQHYFLVYIAYVGMTGQLPFIAKFGFIKTEG